MRVSRWSLPGVAVAVAGLAVAAPGLPVASAASRPGPVVTLEAAQRSVTVHSSQGFVDMDPGIWVASLGSALQFDVRRASYTKPVTITQVIHQPGGPATTRALPATVLDGWNGLKHFIRMTVRNSAGKVVASPWLTFCPNTYDPERVSPDSPATTPYPQSCGFDPFPLSLVLGIAKGWATDPAEDYPFSSLGPGPFMRLPLGKYQVTDTVGANYVKLFHITAGAATQTVKVTVVKGRGAGPAAGHPARSGGRALPPLPRVPYLASPPQNALPDLVPLPSWGISTSHTKAGPDLLNFGATVWVGGNGPLDVEGFRTAGSPIMKAYQYFWQNGKIIGRARAGTMGFDSKHGHNHWHFQQFARYSLLNSAHQLAVPSRKVGFCIAPTDPVDLLRPGATWQPSFLGFGGQCGSPTALWVQEELPLGWGDTYFQSVAGQSFNITNLPNGTYYIEIQANPEHVLYETDTSNDVSLRKVILGGRPGHRTVQVPALDGIDPEG
jgi:Lysyl oxidase